MKGHEEEQGATGSTVIESVFHIVVQFDLLVQLSDDHLLNIGGQCFRAVAAAWITTGAACGSSGGSDLRSRTSCWWRFIADWQISVVVALLRLDVNL